ncbi:MAG: RDD family protein, partial [Chitinispirillaceae bacterium]
MRQVADQGFIQIQNTELFFLENECAGVGSRAAAYFLDFIFKGLIMIVLSFAFGMSGLYEGSVRFISFFILGSVYASYHFLFEAVMGGKTPGKNLLGIRVIKTDGSRITIIDSLLRNVMRTVDYLPFGYMLGASVMFFEKYNRRLGDLVSETLVIHDRSHKKSIRDFVDNALLLTKISKEIRVTGLEKLEEKEKDIIKTIYLRSDSMSMEERERICKRLMEKIGSKVKVAGARDAEGALYEIYKRI